MRLRSTMTSMVLTAMLGAGLGVAAIPQRRAAAQQNRAALSEKDRQFVTEAAQGGMAEVKLGQLAERKAAHADVKKFGQRMVTDHSKANQELRQLATRKNAPLPADEGAKHRATEERLSKLSGAAFDQAYITEMVQDHEQDVRAFERQSTEGQDPDLKKWAADKLPVLRSHLQMAKETAAKVKSGTKAQAGSTKTRR